MLLPDRRTAQQRCLRALRNPLALALLLTAHLVESWAVLPTEFSVTAIVVRGCAVSGSPSQTGGIAFGTVNFGSRAAVQAGSVSAMAGSSGAPALLHCTPGTKVNVTANAGLHPEGSQRRLFHASGSYLPYSLWLVSTSTEVLAPNVPTSLTMGSTAVSLPVMGMATLPGSGLPAGTYTDTVQITLSW